MNSNADSEDVLRVGGFYMLLDLTLTFYETKNKPLMYLAIAKEGTGALLPAVACERKIYSACFDM